MSSDLPGVLGWIGNVYKEDKRHVRGKLWRTVQAYLAEKNLTYAYGAY